MSELKILSHLGYHDNIVNLLGACTQGGEDDDENRTFTDWQKHQHVLRQHQFIQQLIGAFSASVSTVRSHVDDHRVL